MEKYQLAIKILLEIIRLEYNVDLGSCVMMTCSLIITIFKCVHSTYILFLANIYN